jgi:RNA polymerase sigma-70 factor, ECF subfamily
VALGSQFPRTLRAARRGRERAWDAIHADLAPVVLGYLRGRGFPDPEDVCSETFLDVVRGIERFTGDERAFRSWVLTIAHHRGLDAVRRRDRRASDPAEQAALELASPTEPSADDLALEELATEDTARILRTLPPAQREVLLLRVLAGLTVGEIAEVTGRHREAVKGLQKRAIARLRETLADDDRAPDPEDPDPDDPVGRPGPGGHVATPPEVGP